MGNPSISGTVQLGSVINEDIQIVRKIPQINFPTTTTAGTATTGLLGAIRILTIQGVWKGTEVELDTFNNYVESWVNTGASQEKRDYTDSLDNVYQVRCLDYVRNRDIDSPGRMLYTMTFIETI